MVSNTKAVLGTVAGMVFGVLCGFVIFQLVYGLTAGAWTIYLLTVVLVIASYAFIRPNGFLIVADVLVVVIGFFSIIPAYPLSLTQVPDVGAREFIIVLCLVVALIHTAAAIYYGYGLDKLGAESSAKATATKSAKA